MTVKVVPTPDILAALSFTFVVPAGEQWSLRSVVLNVNRGAGGTPNRAYTLVIANGKNVVSAFAAADAGTDPGTCEITWADCPAGTGASGGNGVVSAPAKATKIPTGYAITGAIVGAVAGDSIISAVAWVDFANV